jgi:hypothetical protein
MTTFKHLGWEEEVTVCDCCGKSGLSGTVAFEIEETGAIVNYGSTCAARHTGKSRAKWEGEAKRLEDTRRRAIGVNYAMRARQLPEYAAKEAAFIDARRLHRPGSEHAAHVRPFCQKYSVALAALKAELGITWYVSEP